MNYRRYGRERATGRSTRLIDKYIQEFFTNPIGEAVYVSDHWNDIKAHKTLLERVVSRLKIEHPGVKYSIDRVSNSIMRMS
jgi:hypothetical protein